MHRKDDESIKLGEKSMAKQNRIKNDEINFTRLKLLYVDEKCEIGRGYVEKAL